MRNDRVTTLFVSPAIRWQPLVIAFRHVGGSIATGRVLDDAGKPDQSRFRCGGIRGLDALREIAIMLGSAAPSGRAGDAAVW